jgi:long-chain acyl-CoA synthetase
MSNKNLKRINIIDIIKEEFSEMTKNPAVTRYKKNEQKESITYSKLLKVVDRYSKVLSEIGFKSHDRIALFCEDSIEYVILALAVLDTGAVIVPVSPSLSSNELEYLCKRIKVTYLLSEKLSDKFPLSELNSDKLNSDKLNSDKLNSDKFLKIKIYLYEINKNIKYSKEYLKVENPAFIRFSSGTTGESKGVLLTHKAIIERTSAANYILDISSKDTIGWFLSMSYHFVVSILLFLRKRAHIVLSQDNFPVGCVNSFNKDKPTFLYASPFHYNMLATHKNIESDLLSDVRMAVVTAVSLNKKTEQQFFKKFNIHLSQAYGIIEVGLPFINDRYDDEYICSVGKLLPSYDLKIKDPDAQGQGKILLKGKGMYYAYTSPWKTRKQWFDTGDIGFLKDDYLFISGRSKNVINFAGMKIFPEEVEGVISSFDNIKEVKVFSENHDIYGQLPIAQVVLKSGTSLDIFKLKKHCLTKLDSYKIPKEFIEVRSIEKTDSQKIKRV